MSALFQLIAHKLLAGCTIKFFRNAACIISIFFCCTSLAQQNKYPGFNDEITKRITADSSSKIYIAAININGNKKTKSYIILREIQLKTGDSIIAANLFDGLRQSRDLVYNTSLFSEVELVPVLISATEVIINIRVLEKWYIYPTPEFKLVDRNLNEWLKTYHAGLDRVVYGIKFAHYNLSGRGDRLRIYLLNGYSRAISFSYSAPYSNSALTEGFSFSGGYSQNREFPYKTAFNNSLLQFKKPGFVKDNFYLRAGYQHRRGYFKKHILSISYNYIKVDDSTIVQQYNPGYFNVNKTFVSFPDITYTFQYSNTNNINYPLKGKIYSAGALKRGIGFQGGINMLSVEGAYSLFIPHPKNWYSSLEFQAIVKLPFTQPYINQNALGYHDFNLRGLEYYVIDGVAAAVSKYTLKKKLISFDIPFPFHLKKIPKIPVAIYAKTYADLGYSYNKKEFVSRLGNRLLYSGGFGFDILTIYDATLRLDYSFNQLGENGLFLHAKSTF